jgi:acetylornithine deacetylase
MIDAELFPYIRKLIDIPSVTGSEGDVGRFLAEDLEARGFEVTLQEVAPDRLNVYAKSSGALPRIVFCTHIDTVPPFYASSEDDDYIYGRGSCDAKGIAATMIFATEALREQGVVDVGLLFTVGEEVDSAGAKVANDLESESRYVIVGEPTENRLASGHKGGFKFRLKATGKAAHSAYPHLGESAIAFLLDALAEIRARDWGRNEILGDATINVGTFHGGLAANVFAPEAEADAFIRVVGQVDDVQSGIDEILERHPKVTYDVIAKSNATFCETVSGFDVAPVSFGTDIPSLHAFGKPLLLGPGSIHDAHTSGEKLGKREAIEAVSYYPRLVKQLRDSIES